MCEFCNDDLNLRHSFICTKLNIKPENVSTGAASDGSNFEPKIKIELQEEKEKINKKNENEKIGKKYMPKKYSTSSTRYRYWLFF